LLFKHNIPTHIKRQNMLLIKISSYVSFSSQNVILLVVFSWNWLSRSYL